MTSRASRANQKKQDSSLSSSPPIGLLPSVESPAETPSKAQSETLLRNLLRTAVSTVAYLRDIFPEKNFEDCTVAGLKLKALNEASDESKKMSSWIRDGVFDALKKGYLKALILGISKDNPQHTRAEMIESYNFSLHYHDQTVEFGVQQTVGKEVKPSFKIQSTEEIRKAVSRILKQLCFLTQTLDPLPDTRFIFMRILYTDLTPESYEPPLFRPVEKAETLFFPSEARSFEVGNLQTSYHHLSIDVKTTKSVDEADVSQETKQDKGLKKELEELESRLKRISPNEEDVEESGAPIDDDSTQSSQEEQALHEEIKKKIVRSEDLTLPKLILQFPNHSSSLLEQVLKKIRKEEDALKPILSVVLKKESFTISSLKRALNLGEQEFRSALENLERNGFIEKKGQVIKVSRNRSDLPKEIEKNRGAIESVSSVDSGLKKNAPNKRSREQDEEEGADRESMVKSPFAQKELPPSSRKSRRLQ